MTSLAQGAAPSWERSSMKRDRIRLGIDPQHTLRALRDGVYRPIVRHHPSVPLPLLLAASFDCAHFASGRHNLENSRVVAGDAVYGSCRLDASQPFVLPLEGGADLVDPTRGWVDAKHAACVAGDRVDLNNARTGG